MGKKILLVAPPDRKDFYDFLEKDKTNSYHLIWFDNKEQFESLKSSLASFIREQHYWADFASPQQLIKKLQPDKIVLMEMIDLHQIALIAVARKLGIETIYLDHGAAGNRDTSFERMAVPKFFLKKLPYYFKRLLAFKGFAKTRMFYLAGLSACSSASKKKYLKLTYYFLRHAPLKALYQTHFDERNPETFIVFNKANAEQYSLYFNLDGNKTCFTGVPNFDSYFKPDITRSEKYLVFIEHPYLEFSLFNWDEAHHKSLAFTIDKIARQNGIKIYVKLHPFSRMDLWKTYGLDPAFVEVIQTGDFTDLYLQSELILGFASSLFIGLLSAKKNVVLLGWHPEPRLIGADFFKFGICHTSLNMDEATNQLNEWRTHNKCFENEKGYEEFLNRFNYPFDGSATKRIIEIIGS